MDTTQHTRTALVTGGTAGLGLALVRALDGAGWTVVTDGRSAERAAAAGLPEEVRVIPGDITDPAHRAELVAAVRGLGRLDLLVNNASTLGPVPMQPLARASAEDLQEVWRTNVEAPTVLVGELLPWLRETGGVMVSISSDAAIEHHETWGPYGATKAALDHVTLTHAAETGLRGYAVDPGDMRTAMHQAAFSGEDISDRPLPETVAPHLLRLLDARPGSGRYLAEAF